MDAAWVPPVPHGFSEIRAIFGDERQYRRQDGSLSPVWESDTLAMATLPFPLQLAWDAETWVTRIRCHHKLVSVLDQVFGNIAAAGMQGRVTTFGGCYADRAKRGIAQPSLHTWGIAIDLNVMTNQLGTTGDMDEGVIDLFKQFGFTWGGDFTGRKDPQHFQYATGA